LAGSSNLAPPARKSKASRRQLAFFIWHPAREESETICFGSFRCGIFAGLIPAKDHASVIAINCFFFSSVELLSRQAAAESA
jgi:hypothetical protein